MNVPQEGDCWLPLVQKGFHQCRNTTWYQQKLKNYKLKRKDSIVTLPLGIFLYMDRTVTTGSQKFGLEPVMATTDLLKEELMTDPDSWFSLGYFPEDLKKFASTNDPTDNLQDYHHCLSEMLYPLKQMQRHPPKMDILLGNELRRFILKVFIFAVLGDDKSNDVL